MKRPDLMPPYKHNDLFRPGERAELNACVGKNGGPYDFYAYSRGYFSAGDRLLASLFQDSFSLDLIVYPVIYIYRHAIELALKHLARGLPALWDDDTEIKLSHKLKDNWLVVRPYLLKSPDFGGAELLAKVDVILDDFVEIDPSGEVFRFPESRDGSRFLQDTSHINLLVFGQAMESLQEIFDFWFDTLTQLWDYKCELLQQNA
jgi:hypothetical protein